MPKILIVEDDEELQQMLRLYFQMEKYVVKAVSTGSDANEQLRFASFDAIILDWHLPGMNGLDILKEFRSKGGSTPVIMLSGNDTDEERNQGLSCGANDYLKKPFDLKQLSQRLKALLA